MTKKASSKRSLEQLTFEVIKFMNFRGEEVEVEAVGEPALLNTSLYGSNLYEDIIRKSRTAKYRGLGIDSFVRGDSIPINDDGHLVPIQYYRKVKKK